MIRNRLSGSMSLWHNRDASPARSPKTLQLREDDHLVGQAVAIEYVALRLLLAAYKRKRKRVVLSAKGIECSRVRPQVKKRWFCALIFVQPDAVARWQRESPTGTDKRNLPCDDTQ
jgi:hypothetical protein